MHYFSAAQRLVRWLVVAVMLCSGFAMAQSEPTMSEIYATAQAGKLDEAQKLITHVLISHPNSAKAHFVQSELFARQGNLAKARDALAVAEKLAPGLPFAKPDAVQALRSQLSAKSVPLAARDAPSTDVAPAAALAQSSTTSWGLPLLLTGAVILAGYFIFRRRPPAQPVEQSASVYPNGLTGPQTFGNPAPLQPAWGPTPSGGLGGQIMGGVATGLAVGAGVMAAEAIGRNLMGHHNPSVLPAEGGSNVDYRPTTNTDMGGQDFGISDNTSWDDAGASGGGGDWDT